jgi:hypothetical protein
LAGDSGVDARLTEARWNSGRKHWLDI